MCMKSREVVSGQKIRVSVEGGSFNLCARPFGPFDQTNLQSLVYRLVHMSLRSCTKDGAHIEEVLGRPGWVCPSSASFLVY